MKYVRILSVSRPKPDFPGLRYRAGPGLRRGLLRNSSNPLPSTVFFGFGIGSIDSKG
jgi:hypothetical protein